MTDWPDVAWVLARALWECGVHAGMDTDGDDGPGAMIAGMGFDGFAGAMIAEVVDLRERYDDLGDEYDDLHDRWQQHVLHG